MTEDIGLSKLNIYNDSVELSNKNCVIVNIWDNFVKDTTRKQLVRSAESILAIIQRDIGEGKFNSSEIDDIIENEKGIYQKFKV